MSPTSIRMGLDLAAGDPTTTERLRAALDRSTVRDAAESLGIPVRTIYHWLRRWPTLRPETMVDSRRRANVAKTA